MCYCYIVHLYSCLAAYISTPFASTILHLYTTPTYLNISSALFIHAKYGISTDVHVGAIQNVLCHTLSLFLYGHLVNVSSYVCRIWQYAHEYMYFVPCYSQMSSLLQ